MLAKIAERREKLASSGGEARDARPRAPGQGGAAADARAQARCAAGRAAARIAQDKTAARGRGELVLEQARKGERRGADGARRRAAAAAEAPAAASSGRRWRRRSRPRSHAVDGNAHEVRLHVDEHDVLFFPWNMIRAMRTVSTQDTVMAALHQNCAPQAAGAARVRPRASRAGPRPTRINWVARISNQARRRARCRARRR